MKKNLIVSTDFSQRSFEVIKKSFTFATKHNYQVHIVHILEENFFDILKNKEADVWQASYNHILKFFPDLTKEQFHCRKDSLEDGIERFVKELDAKIVILGSSGERSSVLKQFLGSSTKSIVRSIDVPCLIIKSQYSDFDFSNILIPTDLSEASAKHIQKIHSLFHNVRTTMLHSYVVPFEGRLNFYGMGKDESLSFQQNIKSYVYHDIKQFQSTLLSHNDKTKIEVIKDGLNPECFVNYADENNNDLIAIHTTGNYSFFAFDLLEHSHKDILITKIDKKD